MADVEMSIAAAAANAPDAANTLRTFGKLCEKATVLAILASCSHPRENPMMHSALSALNAF
jgi:hypothetical protein